MMKKLIVLLILHILLGTSCKSGPDEAGFDYDSRENSVSADYVPSAPLRDASSGFKMPDAAREEQSTGTAAISTSVAEKKIIKTAGIRMQVHELEKSRRKINELIKKYHAFIVTENTANTGGSLENNMVVRVAHNRFDALVEEIAIEAAYLNFKNISTRDVTEEFIDVEARLKTKKQVEARYHELLAQARTVEDILKIENELRVIREEIESREGRLKYLKDQVQYSTINLDMYQELAYKPSPKFSLPGRILEAFRRGWDGFVSFFIGLIYIWPFLILLIIVIYFVRKKLSLRSWFRKKKDKDSKADQVIK